MFEDYTIKQLLELRSLCVEAARGASGVQGRADALLLLEYIEEELAVRQRKKSA